MEDNEDANNEFFEEKAIPLVVWNPTDNGKSLRVFDMGPNPSLLV